MERGLIIKKEWLDRILDYGKTWEMRSRPTNIRGRIGLIEAGSGLIIGEAMLMGWVKGNSVMLDACEELHQVEDTKLLEKWPYAWVLVKAKRYDKPIPYTHPNGAVVWVRLGRNKIPVKRFVLRPGPGWQQINGGVWQHKNGSRIHVGGLMVRINGEIKKPLEDREFVSRLIKINGGNRKRGLMAWAMNFA